MGQRKLKHLTHLQKLQLVSRQAVLSILLPLCSQPSSQVKYIAVSVCHLHLNTIIGQDYLHTVIILSSCTRPTVKLRGILQVPVDILCCNSISYILFHRISCRVGDFKGWLCLPSSAPSLMQNLQQDCSSVTSTPLLICNRWLKLT